MSPTISSGGERGEGDAEEILNASLVMSIHPSLLPSLLPYSKVSHSYTPVLALLLPTFLLSYILPPSLSL